MSKWFSSRHSINLIQPYDFLSYFVELQNTTGRNWMEKAENEGDFFLIFFSPFNFSVYLKRCWGQISG